MELKIDATENPEDKAQNLLLKIETRMHVAVNEEAIC